MSVSLINGHIDDDMPKLTDKQIIEAFEYCSRHYDCSKCPIENLCYDIEIGELVLDIINRQNAEIERLRETIIMGRYTSPIAIRAQQSWFRQNSECIKRLKEEIEKLQNSQVVHIDINDQFQKECEHEIKEAKIETVKEWLESKFVEI